MKSNVLLILAMFFTSVAFHTLSAQISGNGLIAYYPLRQGDVTNSGLIENLVSNNYHLTNSSGFGLSYVAGRTGVLNNGNSAALLSSGLEQLRYDYSANPTPFELTSSFSMGAWVSLTAPYTDEYQNIVVVGNNDMYLRFRKQGTNYYIQAGVKYTASNYYSINYYITSPTSWLNDQWHHVALTRGGGYLSLNIDGVEVAAVMSAVQPTFFSATNKTFKVGHFTDPNTHFKGRISDVFYYDRALDPLDYFRFNCDFPNVSPNTIFLDYCGPVSGSFSSNLPSGATSYSWYTSPFDGTPVHTGHNYNPGVISTTTTFYVDAAYTGGCLQRSYPRAKVVVNINSTPVEPTNTTPTANLTICSGTATTLTASTTNNYVAWYTAATGGTLLGTGNSYNTGVLSSTTTFYAASVSPGCGESSRIPIQVTVSPSSPPAPPTIINSVLATCGNNTFTLIANSPGNTINWFDAPTGGTLLFTGTNYTTPALPNPSAYGVEDTYTYYAESVSTCGGSSTRVPVTVTVKYQYDLTALNSNIEVCEGESATLQIDTQAPQNTTTWIHNFSIVATNTYSYTTLPIFASTSYLVTIQPGNDCNANVSFNITTTTVQAPVPANTTPNANLEICNGNSTELSASGTSTIYWYDAPTNGTLLSTGNIYNTNALTANTVFYAQNDAGICASDRISVSVTVNQPSLGIATHNECSPFTWIDGITYTSSNTTAVHTIAGGDVNGCDSIVTLNLTYTIIDNAVSVSGNTLTAQESGASYQWVDCDNGNSPIAGATNQNFTPAISGNYAVEITVNGCTAISACNQLTVSGTTSINEHDGANVTIFPNPANDLVNVENIAAGTIITIYDLTGKIVFSETAKSTGSVISTSNWVNGMYFVKTSFEGTNQQIKLVVNK